MNLILNNKSFSSSEIGLISDFSIYTDFEKSTLKFIQDWERNQQNFILHTSGTTGNPSQITFTRKQLQMSAEMTAKTFNLIKDDVILVCLNTEYVAGIMQLVRGLHLELKMIIFEPTSNPILNISEKIDFTALVPLQLQTILEDQKCREKLNHFKAIIVGGAPISKYLKNQIEELQVPVFQTYAMTETLTHVAIKPLNGALKSSYYRVLENVEISQDSRGCINVKSPVNLGETIVTNDLIHLISKNEFEWIGRIDNIINSGGIKIQIEDIENIIDEFFKENHTKMDFYISSLADDKLGQKVVLYIEGDEFCTNDLKFFFTQKLSKFQVPKSIIFISEFKRTPTGKIIRK